MNQDNDNKVKTGEMSLDDLPAAIRDIELDTIKREFKDTKKSIIDAQEKQYSETIKNSLVGYSVFLYMAFAAIMTVVSWFVCDKFILDLVLIFFLLESFNIRKGSRDAAKWTMAYLTILTLVAVYNIMNIGLLFGGYQIHPEWGPKIGNNIYGLSFSIVIAIWGAINIKYLYKVLKISQIKMNIREKSLRRWILIPFAIMFIFTVLNILEANSGS